MMSNCKYVQTESIRTCTTSTGSMTDTSKHYIKALEQECLELHQVVYVCTVKEWLEDALNSDDQKVWFYTGLQSLNFAVLMSVFNL